MVQYVVYRKTWVSSRKKNFVSFPCQILNNWILLQLELARHGVNYSAKVKGLLAGLSPFARFLTVLKLVTASHHMRSSLFLANLQFFHSITFPALGFWLGGSRSQIDSSSLDFFLIDVITFAAFVKFVFCQIKAKLIPPKVASKKIEETKEGGSEA